MENTPKIMHHKNELSSISLCDHVLRAIAWKNNYLDLIISFESPQDIIVDLKAEWVTNFKSTLNFGELQSALTWEVSITEKEKRYEVVIDFGKLGEISFISNNIHLPKA